MGQGYKPGADPPPPHHHRHHQQQQQQLEHEHGHGQEQLAAAEAPAQDINGDLQARACAGGGGLLRPERRSKPHPNQLLKCPRCESLDTKFCYYNNYSLAQPRYFCKNCKRYWTAGGALRSVPVGGGLRKNKRSKISTPKLSTLPQPAAVPPPPATSSTSPSHAGGLAPAAHYHQHEEQQQQAAAAASASHSSTSAHDYHRRLQHHASLDRGSSYAPADIARPVLHPYPPAYHLPLHQYTNPSAPLADGAAPPAGYALNCTFLPPPAAADPHPHATSAHLMAINSQSYPTRDFDQFRGVDPHRHSAPSLNHPKQEPTSCAEAPIIGAHPPYDWHAISEGLFGPNTGDFFYMPGGSASWPDFHDASAGPGG